MTKQKRPKRPRNPEPWEIDRARAAIMRFSVEQPLLVGPIVYRQLSSYSELSDVMDRVRVYDLLPLEGKP